MGWGHVQGPGCAGIEAWCVYRGLEVVKGAASRGGAQPLEPAFPRGPHPGTDALRPRSNVPASLRGGRGPRSPARALVDLHVHGGRLGHAGQRLLQVAHGLVHGAVGDSGKPKPGRASRRSRRRRSNWPRAATTRKSSRPRAGHFRPGPAPSAGGCPTSGAQRPRRQSGRGRRRRRGPGHTMGKKHKKHKAEWRSSYDGGSRGPGTRSVASSSRGRRRWVGGEGAAGGGGGGARRGRGLLCARGGASFRRAGLGRGFSCLWAVLREGRGLLPALRGPGPSCKPELYLGLGSRSLLP